MPTKQKTYHFIDLFAGAGGLTEGFLQTGFTPVAHVEMDENAAKTLETRSAYYYLKTTGNLTRYRAYLTGKISRDEFLSTIPDNSTQTVINETLSNETIPTVFTTIDTMMKKQEITTIDVIIGGPPCQAYSLVGRAQSPHMKTPMSEDPRNYLYMLYAQFLKKYQPRMFVFENVIGIKSAQSGTIWKNLQNTLQQAGYEIECHEQNAQNFGVLQNRRRMIIVGWLKNSNLTYPDFPVTKADAIVNDLFRDLPPLHHGERNNTYSTHQPSNYVVETGIRTNEDILTLHESREENVRNRKIYEKAITLWNDGYQRLNYNDLPESLKTHKNRHSFTDRFKVVEGDQHCCHTILAHLSKDGNYFIHPDMKQLRSITVREAARIQSFPDNFYFEGSRTAQFKQIGNAVPPLMARGIAQGILHQLRNEDNR